MNRRELRHAVTILLVGLGAAAVSPTLLCARQNTHQFNQDWWILGPYYRDNTGGNPGDAAVRLDYLTNGVVTETNIIPTTGLVVNTNYALAASYSFVWLTWANGYSVPTVFTYKIPADDGNVDLRGGTTAATQPPNCVFDQGRNFAAATYQGNNRLNQTMVYAFAFANNKTGGPLSVYIGTNVDDRIQVLIDGVERRGPSGGGTYGTANYVNGVSGPFTLNPGKSLVTIKVFNGTGGYGFRARFQSSNATGVNQGAGTPASQVEWTLDPTGWPGYPPPPPTPNPGAGVWRRVSNSVGYVPGTPLRVDVRVTTNNFNPTNLVVREWPPQGWTVSTPAVAWGTAAVVTTSTYGGRPYTGPYIWWNIGSLRGAPTNMTTMTYWLTPPAGPPADGLCTGTLSYSYNPQNNPANPTTITKAVVGRDQYIMAPTAVTGTFNWGGAVGTVPLGDEYSTYTGKSYVAPITSGTFLSSNPRFQGWHSYDAGTGAYTISTAGDSFDGGDDNGRMLVKSVTGDFIISADVEWTSPSFDNDCKAFVGVRNSISRGSVWAAGTLRNLYNPNSATDWGQPFTNWRRRDTNFGSWRRATWYGGADQPGGYVAITTKTTEAPGGTIIPAKLKMVRRGNTVDSYYFLRGAWLLQGRYNVTQLTSTSVLAFLGVSSDQTASSATARFTNVSVTPVPLVSATRSFLNNGIYTTQGMRVKIFLKNGGGTAAITVRDYAPVGWTITSFNPPGATVDDASTITWALGAFNADTTLTYDLAQPALDWILPGLFGNGVVNDQTNFIGVTIGGPNAIQRYRVTTFQQGQFPYSAYAGTADTHIIRYRSPGGGTNYPLSWGLNIGWNNTFEEGDNHNDGNADDNKLMLIRFNVADIGPMSTVFGAQLRLYHVSNRSWPMPLTSGTYHRINAAKLNRDWAEGRGMDSTDGTYANLGEATWLWAKAGISPWASWGARGGSLDGDMPESFADASTPTIGTWLAWDVTRMVTEWVSAPSSNYGIKLSQDTQNTTGWPRPWFYQRGMIDFASRNYGTVDLRPMLSIMAFVPDRLRAQHWELYR